MVGEPLPGYTERLSVSNRDCGSLAGGKAGKGGVELLVTLSSGAVCSSGHAMRLMRPRVINRIIPRASHFW